MSGPARRYVVLGTGDVTRRYLLPAVAELVAAGCLDEPDVVLVARDERSDGEARVAAAEALETHAGHVPTTARRRVAGAVRAVTADAADAEALRAAFTGAAGPVVVHLALPPQVFGEALTALATAGIPPGSRIVVEKPFGTDLEHARELNRLLADHFEESAVFRMDHFLGEQTVRNLLGLRFANRVLGSLWSAEHVERVEIVWDETVALEGRAGFYDRTGALRDMVQSHLLQLLGLVAMEPPAGLDPASLRSAKAELLGRIRLPDGDHVARHGFRARYGAGRVEGRDLPAYVEEDGVDPARGTETFVALSLFVDTPRWRGVPFHLRTGKALARDRREIRIRFRPVEHPGFGGIECPANELVLTMTPDAMALSIATNGAGDPFSLERTVLDARLGGRALGAYATLLLDAFRGTPSLTVRGDEAEASWRVVEAVRHAWDAGVGPLGEYPAGTDGPDVAPGWSR